MVNCLFRFVKKILPKKIKSSLRALIFHLLGKPGYFYEIPSFSQAGEDAVLRFLFTDYSLDLSKISYIDIGARHPMCGSNTYLLYTHGARGVSVDADEGQIQLIKKHRPRDTVLNVGVSAGDDSVGDFYFMESGGSTFDKEEAEQRERLGIAKVLKVVQVPLLSINTLIQQNFKTYPTLISIDIEGLDLPVLKTLDFDKYPIPVICVETCRYSTNHIRPKDHEILQFIMSKGYEVYADTYINTIFVNKEWFYSKR